MYQYNCGACANTRLQVVDFLKGAILNEQYYISDRVNETHVYIGYEIFSEEMVVFKFSQAHNFNTNEFLASTQMMKQNENMVKVLYKGKLIVKDPALKSKNDD